MTHAADMSDSLSGRLEVASLQRALEDLSWSDVKCMAIQLDGRVDLTLLNDVEREHPIEERVLYAMKAWLDRDCEASWVKVVSALRAISKNVLAKKIENEYCRPMTTPRPLNSTSFPSESGHCYSTVVSPPPPTELEPVAHSLLHKETPPSLGLASCHPQTEDKATSSSMAFSQVATTTSSSASLVPAIDYSATVGQGSSVDDRIRAVTEDAAQLQTQFVTVLTHTKICFVGKEAESGNFLSKFRITLTTLPLSNRYQHLEFLRREKNHIKKAKDIEEIFDILEPYWNYVDYAFLEYIIKEFGTSELQKEMKGYIAELEQFEKNASVQDYDSASLGEVSVPAYFKTVEIMQVKDPKKCSLYEVRQFQNEIVNRSTLKGYAVLRKRVSCSSVELVLAFPPEAYGELLEVFDVQFMTTHEIVSKVFSDGAPFESSEDTAFSAPMKRKSDRTVGQIEVLRRAEAQLRHQEDTYPTQIILHRLEPDILTQGRDGRYLHRRDYDINEHLSSGIFSTCVAARDHKTDELFVIKSSCNETINTLRSESDIRARIPPHKNITRFLGAILEEEQDGLSRNCHLMMELAEHGTLFEMLVGDEGGPDPLSLDQSLFYLHQVLQGLHHLHSCNIVHLNINAQTILVLDGGRRVKLNGFTMATDVDEIESKLLTLPLTASTLPAPEIVRGQVPSFSCDIWSAACVLIHLITARLPGSWGYTRSRENMLFMIGNYRDKDIEQLIPLSDIPDIHEDVSAIFYDSLREDPQSRPTALQLLSYPALVTALEFEQLFDLDQEEEIREGRGLEDIPGRKTTAIRRVRVDHTVSMSRASKRRQVP